MIDSCFTTSPPPSSTFEAYAPSSDSGLAAGQGTGIILSIDSGSATSQLPAICYCDER